MKRAFMIFSQFISIHPLSTFSFFSSHTCSCCITTLVFFLVVIYIYQYISSGSAFICLYSYTYIRCICCSLLIYLLFSFFLLSISCSNLLSILFSFKVWSNWIRKNTHDGRTSDRSWHQLSFAAAPLRAEGAARVRISLHD